MLHSGGEGGRVRGSYRDLSRYWVELVFRWIKKGLAKTVDRVSRFLFTIYSPFSPLIRHIYIICVIINETMYNERLFSYRSFQGYFVRQDP